MFEANYVNAFARIESLCTFRVGFRSLMKCDLCDAGYVGYTRGHLHTRVDGHKQKASSIYKHYHEQHSEVPKDLLKRFSIQKSVEICLIVW